MQNQDWLANACAIPCVQGPTQSRQSLGGGVIPSVISAWIQLVAGLDCCKVLGFSLSVFQHFRTVVDDVYFFCSRSTISVWFWDKAAPNTFVSLSRQRLKNLKTSEAQDTSLLVWTSECEWHSVSETIKIHSETRRVVSHLLELVWEHFRQESIGKISGKEECKHNEDWFLSLFIRHSKCTGKNYKKNSENYESWSRGACWLGSIIAGGNELLGTPIYMFALKPIITPVRQDVQNSEWTKRT